MPLTSVQHSPKNPPWKICNFCRDDLLFKSPRDFSQHLRDFHCSKEGGSYVCRYGMNGVCPSLPLEGVSDRDYEDHVLRDHIHSDYGGVRGKIMTRNSQERLESQSSGNSDPNIVQDQYKWTIHNATVNLPALLNDPRLVKRETDFFTKTWGQSFERVEILPSPYVPEIGPEHFEKYVRKTSVRLKKHSRNKESLSSTSQSDGRETHPSAQLRQMEQNRAELDQIKLFMSAHFSLENPDVFNTVFPWSQIEGSKGSSGQGDQRQSSKLLQEKLSHYLDIVEVRIARQISQKSDAFFHAMASHDKLQEKLNHTVCCIKRLRECINVVNEKMAKESLKVLKLSRTRANYMALFNKLKIMASIHETQPTIQRLLSNNEFIGSLDLISTSQDVLTKDLAGIHSFKHLGSQLAEMEVLIDKMLQADFSRSVTSELNRPVSDKMLLAEEERLVSILFGMLRQRKFNFVDVYREEAFTAIKAIVKQTVVEAVAVAEDIDTENATSLADQMRLLNYSQWMDLLQTAFINIMVLLNRTKAFYGVVSDVVGIAAGKTKAPTTMSPSENGHELSEAEHLHVSVSDDVDVMISEAEYEKVQTGLKEMLSAICDYAHDRCVKVMSARAKDGFLERLSSAEFVSLSREIEAFVADTELVCGRKSMSLRGILQAQANKFVARFHEERKTKLSSLHKPEDDIEHLIILILDNERWKQADVPAEFQDLVNHIVSSGNLTLPEKRSDSESKPTECLKVGEEEFAVVGTVLMLIKMMMEYCQCVVDIPSATPDLLTRLIDLLKMFNSRTCQLLIGAGARQMVGLKTISTKNLALASRCLQLVVHFIPQVKNHFEKTLPSKNSNMLKNFEKIVKDYDDHIEEISHKLVTISENMAESQLSKYEVKAPMPSQCFRTICKQLAKLHEALIGILGAAQIRALFTRMNESFLRQLSRRLVVLGVTNDGGPQYGLVISDLVFYSGSFNTLKGLEGLVTDTNSVWDLR